MALEKLGTPEPDKLTAEELVDHCVHANEYVLDTIGSVRDVWDSHWQLYNNQYDWTDKADFQARAFIPKVNMAVRVARATLKQSLIKSQQFFAFKGLNPESISVEKACEEGLMKLLDQADFKQKKFDQGLFLGFLENLIVFKIFPAPLEEGDRPIDRNQEFKIVIQPVSAYDFRIDPTGRNRFVIHKIRMDASDYRALVKRGVYRKESLEAVDADFIRQEEAYKESIRQGLTDVAKPAWRREVELLEYWGDVDNDRGERIYENVTYTVVNDQAIARMPVKNPFRHKQPPFVWGPIIEKVGAVYSEGFLDNADHIARLLTESWCMVLDANAASSIKAYEVNIDYVQNPSDLKSGIYPGKTIKVRGVPPGSQAVREFTLGVVNPSALNILVALDREFQNATGISEFIAGLPGIGDQTATETKIKSGAARSLMQSVAQNVEDNVLEDAIEMVFSEALQYNPEVFGPAIGEVSSESLRFDFQAKGMSKLMEQNDEMQKLFMWAGMLAKTPAGQKVNWDEIAKISARLINVDPRTLLLAAPPAPPAMPGAPGAPQPTPAVPPGLEQLMMQGARQ